MLQWQVRRMLWSEWFAFFRYMQYFGTVELSISKGIIYYFLSVSKR